MPTRKRRFIAFLIDLAIFGVIWATIDNTLTLWLPSAITNLLEAALFCVYFWLTEGRSSRHASLGKRWSGIKIATRTGSTPSERTAVLRSVVLAAMLVFDWTSLLVPIPAVPHLAILLAEGIPLGFVLYNVWISIKDPNQPLVQDFLTDTMVLKADVSVAAGASAAGSTRWPYRQALIPAFILSVGGSVDAEQGFLAPSLNSQGEQISKAVYDELGIRTRVFVEAKTVHEARRDVASTIRNLSVSVWIPALSWMSADWSRVAEVVVFNLDVEPAAFDTWTLSLRTGTEHLFIGRTSELTHPSFVVGSVYWRRSAREGISQAEERRYEDKAIAEYRNAIRADPDFAPPHLELARAYYFRDENERALVEAEQAVRLAPESDEAHYMLGDIHRDNVHRDDACYDRASVDAAVRAYQEAVRLAPDSPHAHRDLSDALAHQGRYELAVFEAQRAVELHDTAQNRAELGIALRQAGRHEQAVEEFREALKQSAEYARAQGAFALTLFIARRYEEATEAYEKFLALRDSPSIYAVFHYHLALRHLGRDEEARRLLEHHVGWADEPWEGHLLAFYLGTLSPAQLQRHAENDCQRSEISFYVGYERLLEGRTEEARQGFEAALSGNYYGFMEPNIARARLTQLSEPKT